MYHTYFMLKFEIKTENQLKLEIQSEHQVEIGNPTGKPIEI